MVRANMANQYSFQHLAVFSRKFKTGGNQPEPLINRSTVHSRLPQPDGEREQGQGEMTGELPAGGERPGGGLGATAGSLGSGRAAVASPETGYGGGMASAAEQLEWSSSSSSAASKRGRGSGWCWW